MLIREVTDENFSKLLSENDYVLAFFRTDWCPLCDYVEKILTKIQAEHNLINVFIIDFDKNEILVNKYKIIGIPTVVTFEYGEMTECLPGAREESSYFFSISSVL
jgi:thioredoxin 1